MESEDICKKENMITPILLHQQTPASAGEQNSEWGKWVYSKYSNWKKETDFYYMADCHLR